MNLLTILLDQAAGGFLGAKEMNIVFIVLIFVVFYFFMIRPQQKRQKEIQKARETMKVGDKVVLGAGIYGKIREIKGNIFTIEIADNVKIKVDKSAVYNSPENANQDAQSNNNNA